MTNTVLKAQIDSQITNETTENGITPTEVGGNLKAIVDYVDQETVFKENSANKSTDGTMASNSDAKYPSEKAVKTYADAMVVGLLDDRGNYDASGNTYPSTGGSGLSGAILKGDLWYVSVGGTLGGVTVPVGASIRALVNVPAQSSASWSILNVGLGFTPENSVNKSTSVTTDGASDSKYPSVKSVKTYVDQIVSSVSSGVSTDKVVRVSLTSNELKSLFTTPKLLLANEAGKVKIIKSWYIHKNAGTGYSNNYGFSIINQAGQNMFASMSNSYMTFPQEVDGTYDFSNNNHGWETSSVSNLWIGRSFYLKSDSFDMLSGTCTLDIYISYLEISL